MHPFEAKIAQARHITVIAHVRPDADSLGSASAFYSYLLQLQKKVSFFCATSIESKYLFIPWVDKICHIFPKSSDLCISFDCGSFERMGLEPSFEVEVINFDHHKSNTDYGDVNRVDETAISTTQAVYDYLKYMQVKINPKMATAMYAGLLDDSRGFLSEKTNPRTFATAYDLIQKKADAKSVVRHLFETVSLSELRVKGMIFSNLRLECNGQLAVIAVDEQMLAASGALCSMCENALEETLYLPTVEVSVLLCDLRDGSFKGSFRSKGRFDASELATKYGGGGHHHAAGFHYKSDTIDAAMQRIILDFKELV